MEFYLTGMGRKFYEADVPRIAQALERIADRLATFEQATATLEQVAGPEPGEPIAEVHCPCCGAHLEVEHGDDEGDVAVVGTRANPGDDEAVGFVGMVKEKDQAIFNVRRGLKRGAELIRAYDNQISSLVQKRDQREILDFIAHFLDGHAETYGANREADNNR